MDRYVDIHNGPMTDGTNHMWDYRADLIFQPKEEETEKMTSVNECPQMALKLAFW